MRSIFHRFVVLVLAGMALCITATIAAGAEPSWRTVAPTLTEQGYAVAAAGLNGQVYLFGNRPGYRTVASTNEVYDPAKNAWAMLPPMNPGRFAMGVASLNGKIYILGGNTPGIGVRCLNQVYDPATSTWTTLAPMPLGGENIAAAAGPDGKVYVFGGDRKNWGVDGVGDLKSVQVYDPTTNTWTYNRDLPAPLTSSAATLGSNGRIYLINGYNRRSTGDKGVWAYDTSAGTFTQVASLNWWEEGLGAAPGKGVIYAIGGLHVGVVGNVEVYNIASNSWSKGPQMPHGKDREGVAETPDGTIYAISGLDPSLDTTQTVYALNP